MSQVDTAAHAKGDEAAAAGRRASTAPPRGGATPALSRYKPQQGRSTRVGTLVGAGALLAWGAVFLQDQLRGFEGDNWYNMLVTPGIPIVVAVGLFTLVYWAVYVNRPASDFLIATEGEMKKVNWSSRNEVIGSTKVVILFTILMAVLLFVVDVIFQRFFQAIGVLKV